MVQRAKGLCVFLLATAPALFATSGGAPAGVTGAPGEGTCSACHGNGTPNSGGGNVAINFPQASYKGGETYRVSVTITDGSARRWGFELSPRQTSSTSTQAGILATVDANTRVLTQGNLQYITHTTSGTRSGTAGPTSFEFDWTAPAAGTGAVTFYVAANAANNNFSDGPGDNIYTSSKEIPEESAGAKPTIRTDQTPALQSWGGRSDFASNTYLEIYGSNFGGGACSAGGRQWQGSDFNGSNAPTSLDGTSVTVNGKPAFIYFVCDGQININTPDDTATGPVPVVVKTAAGESNTVNVNRARYSPALLTGSAFTIGERSYVIAQVSNTTTLVGRPGLISGVTFQAVKAGDSITLYALGLGETTPATQAGVVNATNANVNAPLQVTIGGQPAAVTFAAMVAGTIGYYQVNVTVPTIGAGDQPIELTVDGVATNQGLYLSNP